MLDLRDILDNGGLGVEFETEVRTPIQRTHNVKSFRFDRPENFSYKAGQFMFITIKIEEKEKQKHFTISSKGWKGYKGYINKDVIEKEMPTIKKGHFISVGLPRWLKPWRTF